MEVLHFWFEECTPEQWFTKNEDFDALIRARFIKTHQQAAAGELYAWRTTLSGRLAEIIVLDQFSRNIFRGTPQAFSQDAMGLALAQEALRHFDPLELPLDKRAFLYMPFMHSESLVIHEQAVELFSQPGLEDHYKYELLHKKIIERFGRYPHRNAILGRISTPEEIAFLKEPNSSF